jgi:DNA-binding NarL/FixJ family response regulator
MPRILLADCQEVVRVGLRKIVEAQPGWSAVGEAADGKQAIVKALEMRPDVVIIDYVLPILNGIEVTRQVRARIPQARVLIFTMNDSDQVVGEALQAGARAYLLKSAGADRIVAAIKALLGNRSYLPEEWAKSAIEGYLIKPEQNGSALSPKERVVVQLIAEGHSNKEMSRMLNLSIKTIESHRAAALQKLRITTTAGLVRYAIRNQIVDP